MQHPTTCEECQQPIVAGQAVNGVLGIHWACYVKTDGYFNAQSAKITRERLDRLGDDIRRLRARITKL